MTYLATRRLVPITTLVTSLALSSTAQARAAADLAPADVVPITVASADEPRSDGTSADAAAPADSASPNVASADGAADASPAPAADSADAGGGAMAEITISGDKESGGGSGLQSVHDVPQSISVLTGDDLKLQNSVDMGSITRRASNVKWNSGNSREFSFSIRGLGYQANTEAEDPSVGVNVDGVAYAYNPLTSFEFTDIDNVEVLRGPQGTAGGKNANVGLINVTTNAPKFTPEASYSLAYGRFNSVIGWGVLGGSVIDDLLAWRGTVSVDKEGGYVKNLYNPSETYGNRDRVSGRLQFLLTPTANFKALVRLDLEPTGGEFYNGMTIFTPTPGHYGNGAPNPLTTDASTRLARSWFTQQSSYTYAGSYLYGGGQIAVNNNSQRPLITRSQGASAELDWTPAENYTVTSITAYKDYHFYASNDEGTPFDVTTASGGGVDYRQATQELRLTYTGGGLLDYRTGFFLLESGTQGPLSVAKSGWGSDAGAWFANPSQYTTLDADGNGRSLLVNSLDGTRKAGFEHDLKKTAALYVHADWHLTDSLTLTTGARASYEYRTTVNNTLITSNGFGAALNPVAVNNVQLGGFGSDSSGKLLPTDTAQQISLADQVAQQYFNVPAYAALTANQMKQVAAAKALRQAQLGVLWNTVYAQPFKKVQPGFLLTPSYKINPEVTAYVSVQHGEKAGISQTTNGVSNLTQPEKSTAYELGAKTLAFNDKLTLNADVFLNNVSNYQQAVQVFDAYTTALNHDGNNYYISATGNAAKVQVKGLELDATYSGIPDTLIRFSGAYNDAVYKDFKNAGQPLENANQSSPYHDATGQTLAGAAKFTFNVDVAFRRTVFRELDFFTNADTTFTSAYNSDVTGLSSYAWIPAHSITDFSIGVGRSDRHFDISLLVKNLFNDQSHLATTWNSYTPAPPRWVGVMVNAAL